MRLNHELAAVEYTVARLRVKTEDRLAGEELTRALQQLSDDGRELIVLRIWSGLTWQQIAELTRTTSRSAQRRYLKELRKLKLILEPTCTTNLKRPQS